MFNKNIFLWVAGISSILGMSKTRAQNPTAAADSIFFGKSTRTETVYTGLSIKSLFNTNFTNLTDAHSFLSYAKSLHPQIEIDSVFVDTDSKLAAIPAHYNPTTKKVRVKYFLPYDGRFVSETGLSKEEWDQEIKLKNDMLFTVLPHELGHWYDYNSYSTAGFTRAELIKLNIHRELSKRVFQLLSRRTRQMSIFKNEEAVQRVMNMLVDDRNNKIGKRDKITKEAVLAQFVNSILTGANDSKLFRNIQDEEIGRYGYWLYDEFMAGRAGENISQMEIDLMLETAMDFMSVQIFQYYNEMPKLLLYDFTVSYQDMVAIKKTGKTKTGLPPTLFNNAVNMAYTADGINFLNGASEQTMAKVQKFINDCTKKICKEKKVAELMNMWSALDDAMIDFSITPMFEICR
ncbi:MAG: hypothetical protein LBJ18_01575 [Rickettsiales bacterium]|nr:hypothetical protein [Rickettsiales bacterium]